MVQHTLDVILDVCSHFSPIVSWCLSCCWPTEGRCVDSRTLVAIISSSWHAVRYYQAQLSVGSAPRPCPPRYASAAKTAITHIRYDYKITFLGMHPTLTHVPPTPLITQLSFSLLGLCVAVQETVVGILQGGVHQVVPYAPQAGLTKSATATRRPATLAASREEAHPPDPPPSTKRS